MKERILIVDDEVDFCMIMKNYFMKREYDVSLAFNLEEGLNKVEEFRPTILFLDNNLPDGHGWDNVQQIVEILPQLKIFLVSAHRNKFAFEGVDKNNVVVLEKPISFSSLNSYF